MPDRPTVVRFVARFRETGSVRAIGKVLVTLRECGKHPTLFSASVGVISIVEKQF